MKENYVIIITVVLIFLVAAIIRKKTGNHSTYGFWSSIVAIAAFSFLYVREWFIKGDSRPGSMEWVMPVTLLYVGLMAYLIIKAVRSYKLMHSK